MQESAMREEAMAISTPNLLERYEIVMEIGRGGQGIVFLATRRGTEDLFACKSVPAGENAENEVAFMERLVGCKGMVKLYEVIRDRTHCHMIIELCDSNMRDRIQRVGALSKGEAASFFKRLAAAVDGPPYDVRVADLGCAAVCPRNTSINTGCMSGTRRYYSPEGAWGIFSSASDVWALGIILYECLSGKMAFEGMSSKEVLEKLLDGVDVAADLDWSRVSDDAKEFILQMLRFDPRERLTIRQILKHPWIAQNVEGSKRRKRKRKRKVEKVEIEQQPAKIRKLVFRQVDGKWQMVKAQEQV